VMYDIPGRTDIRKCVVNAEAVINRTRPLLLTRGGQTVDVTVIPSATELRGESA